jgi:hypothetical protein
MVVRRPRLSTTPERSPILTTSPTLNWRSKTMSAPVMTSLTRLCVPKPIAKPTIPALARIGPISSAHAQTNSIFNRSEISGRQTEDQRQDRGFLEGKIDFIVEPSKAKRRPLFQACSVLPSDPSPPMPERRSGADALGSDWSDCITENFENLKA